VDGSPAFLAWAARASVPLDVLGQSDLGALNPGVAEMIGDATVVALSEAVHGESEPLELRNQLLRYLVERRYFTAIAIESGLVESRVIHEYVRGGPGELSEVISQGFSWGFESLAANAALVRWLRDYNAGRAGRRMVNVYGLDMAGSPGNPHVKRGVSTAICATLDYLRQVDERGTVGLRDQFLPWLGVLRFDPQRRSGYPTLSRADRDSISSAIEDVMRWLKSFSPGTATTATREYVWACQAAIAARQVDTWLRQIPLESSARVDTRAPFGSAAADIRDRAQADNVAWILDQEGSDGKVLLFASRYHMSKAPVTTRWWSAADAGPRTQQVAGTLLRQRLGAQLVTIGHLTGSKADCGGDSRQRLTTSLSLDVIAGLVGPPRYLLDLRSAPGAVARWLDQEHTLGQGQEAFTVNPYRAFDLLFYLDRRTPVVQHRCSE